MSITDVTFLFVFLPLALCTYVLKPALQKYLLLILSLFFYACGSPQYFFLFIFAKGINIIFLINVFIISLYFQIYKKMSFYTLQNNRLLHICTQKYILTLFIIQIMSQHYQFIVGTLSFYIINTLLPTWIIT